MPVLDTLLSDYRRYSRGSTCNELVSKPGIGQFSVGNVNTGGSCFTTQEPYLYFAPNIPAFSIINSAVLYLNGAHTYTDSTNKWVLSVLDSLDAPLITTVNDFKDAKDNDLVGSTSYNPVSWDLGEWKTTTSFGWQLQSVINKTGWESGNSVCVFILHPTTSASFRNTMDGATDSSKTPILRVDYTEAENFRHLDLVSGQLKEVNGLSGNYLTRETDGSFKRNSGLETTGALILEDGIIKEKS